MNISKAIEILELEETGDLTAPIQDLNDAIRLGIEALKLIQELRKWGVPRVNHTLPGETKD